MFLKYYKLTSLKNITLALLSNINFNILQCGTLSEFFNIERGCRQGDPISAYLFILCAQPR